MQTESGGEQRPPERPQFTVIWRLMEGQRGRYGAAMGALVLGACFLYLAPLVPQIVLDGVLSPEPEKASKLVSRAMEIFGGRDFLRAHLWLAAAAMVLITAIAGYLTWLRGRWAAFASEEIARGLRDRLYDRLQRLPCAWHDTAATGDTVQRCTSDVETFRQFLSTQVVEIGRAVFMALVPIPLMLAIDARMTLVAVAIVPPVVVFSYFYFRRVRSTFKAVDEAEGRMTSAIQENLTGVRVVRAFARQDWELERFDGKNTVHRDLDYRLYKLLAVFWSVSDLVCMFQNGLVLAVGGYWLATGQMQVGAFYFFLAAVNLFIWPVRMLGRILTELGKATVAISRIGEILDQPTESAPAEPASLVSGSRGSEIVFESIGFAHPNGKVLDGVSFRVDPGETLALLGPSGSGKSTLIHLLLRFYDPAAGRILIDGVDIARIPRQEVRENVSVVLQEPFLYSKTVEENIRFGRSHAREEDIRDAAAAACVHEAIVEFEAGYRTVVGERGVTLSGGQRQRVALARALLRDTPILVLDDALSAVDTDTETEILDALRRYRGSRTILVIAHRLSTLMHADRILVLDHGRILQQGTHAELRREDGLYRRLWEHQRALEEDIGGAARVSEGIVSARSDEMTADIDEIRAGEATAEEAGAEEAGSRAL